MPVIVHVVVSPYDIWYGSSSVCDESIVVSWRYKSPVNTDTVFNTEFYFRL